MLEHDVVDSNSLVFGDTLITQFSFNLKWIIDLFLIMGWIDHLSYLTSLRLSRSYSWVVSNQFSCMFLDEIGQGWATGIESYL